MVCTHMSIRGHAGLLLGGGGGGGQLPPSGPEPNLLYSCKWMHLLSNVMQLYIKTCFGCLLIKSRQFFFRAFHLYCFMHA